MLASTTTRKGPKVWSEEGREAPPFRDVTDPRQTNKRTCCCHFSVTSVVQVKVPSTDGCQVWKLSSIALPLAVTISQQALPTISADCCHACPRRGHVAIRFWYRRNEQGCSGDGSWSLRENRACNRSSQKGERSSTSLAAFVRRMQHNSTLDFGIYGRRSELFISKRNATDLNMITNTPREGSRRHGRPLSLPVILFY